MQKKVRYSKKKFSLIFRRFFLGLYSVDIQNNVRCSSEKLALDVYTIQKTKAKLLSDIHLEHIQNVL